MVVKNNWLLIKLINFWIKEIPDKNGVVMRTADYLKVVELKSKNAPSVFDQSAQAECSSWRTRVESSSQVPNFNFSNKQKVKLALKSRKSKDIPIISSADDALVVHSNASNQFIMTF